MEQGAERDTAAIHRPARVLTIGHSNHSVEHLLGLLTAAEVEVLVDVRSHPRSRFAPQFNRDALAVPLRAAGLAYLHLGAELGGRPSDASLYENGQVRYDRVARSAAFRGGLARLEEGTRRYRVAVMCAEEDPRRCHRRLLITPALQADGFEVEHLRGDGSAISDADLARAEGPRVEQAGLFDEDPSR